MDFHFCEKLWAFGKYFVLNWSTEALGVMTLQQLARQTDEESESLVALESIESELPTAWQAGY